MEVTRQELEAVVEDILSSTDENSSDLDSTGRVPCLRVNIEGKTR
jgi:hypothetical protein